MINKRAAKVHAHSIRNRAQVSVHIEQTFEMHLQNIENVSEMNNSLEIESN